MTSRTGGQIPPDGRRPQAKGIGRNAKRHDLERPKASLQGTDLQYGEVSEMEAGQRLAPLKRKQPPATPGAPSAPRSRQGVQRGSGQFSMAVPDPIELAGSRIGGQAPGSDPATGVEIDPSPWVPMLQQMALTPGASGGLVDMLMEKLTDYRRHPVVNRAQIIDLNTFDEILGE